ncbi:type VI secretion system Vgr family protein [Chitinimonas sp. PSY-7]|uniref:type VI secretion system tip protein TssI/VgrG n=1 Tax=Chitinimonas sp. PSY-7 TaxID=3459088 RepID=UPI004040178E
MSSTALLAQFLDQQNQWQSTERLYRLHTKLGPDALLVERVDGIEQIIGAPLPKGNVLLPNPKHFPVGSSVAAQAAKPNVQLGHMPLLSTLRDSQAVNDSSLLCGYRFEVTALSAKSGLDLNSLLGAPVLLEVQTSSSRTALRPVHGHVSAAQALGSNGGLARYRLVVEPWLSFLRQRRDSWVFQDKTVAEILDSLFSDYQSQGALAPAWKLALADKYPKRSLLAQYRETDWHFVRRLIEDEGLVCWFEHEGDTSSASLGRHTLIISDRLGLDAACANNPESPLRFHRASAVEGGDGLAAMAGALGAGPGGRDTFQEWQEQRQVIPGKVRLLSYDDRTLSNQAVEASVPIQNHGPKLELDDHISHYGWAGAEDGERRALNLLAAYQTQGRHIYAGGTVRSLAPGQVFELSQHHRYPKDARFRVLSVHHQGRNNLSADFKATLNREFSLDKEGEDFPEHYLNHAVCLYARAAIGVGESVDTPFAPSPITGSYHSKPTVQGIQTATVVGLGGLPIDTDRNHRVKVQFHWQRGSSAHNRQTHATGDDNAPANERAWAWVRVGATAAGPNWGSAFVPRIGQEVLVNFLDGDIDRPIVVGAAYNGTGNSDAQHNEQAGNDGRITANAAFWFAGDANEHAHPDCLSGIKTQAISQSQYGQSDKQVGGFNQLVFDDHPEHPRAELGTTQAYTWLQLGQARHHQDNARRESRGHGASLDTRGHAAVRAGQGLLISAQVRPNANGGQMDSQEAEQTLTQQRDRLNAILERAGKHSAQLPEEKEAGKHPVEEHLKSLQDSLAVAKQGAPAWTRPNQIHSAPQGIGWLTAGQFSLNANEHLAMIGRDLQIGAQVTLGITAQEGLRVFAGGAKPDGKQPEQTQGIRLLAASGQAIVQAQKDKANLNAKKAITASTNADALIASPTVLKLTAQGAGMELKDGNITLYVPNGLKMQASQKIWEGPAAASHQAEKMPTSQIKGCAQKLGAAAGAGGPFVAG